MENLLATIFSEEFAFSILRVTNPLLFAALAALITSRAGVLNIALEGIMLMAAFVGVVASAYSQSVLVGIGSGLASGCLIALLMAWFALKLKADIILTGLAVNMFASGATVFMMYMVCNDKATTMSLPSLSVPALDIPILRDIPVIGPIVNGHNILTYVAFLCVFLTYILVFRTPLGLRIRAVGENIGAAQSVGIHVLRTQFIAIMLSGILAAFGGLYMSMGYMSFFSRDMIAGRGFIGLAAQSLGAANPGGTLIASLIFGAADALSNILQTLRVPAEFVQLIPYATSIVGLVLYAVVQERKVKRRLAKKTS